MKYRLLCIEVIGYQYVVDGVFQAFFTDADPARRVALRVDVDDQDLSAFFRQSRGEVDGRRGLSDPALLVGYCYGSAHTFSFERTCSFEFTIFEGESKGVQKCRQGTGRDHAASDGDVSRETSGTVTCV